MRGHPFLCISLVFAVAIPGCASFSLSGSAQDLRSEEKPAPVRVAASVGETSGFVLAVPVSVALWPVWVPAVHILDVGHPYELLFLPSIKCGEALAVIIGGLVDIVVSPFTGGPEA